jgi:hypothetical protein
MVGHPWVGLQICELGQPQRVNDLVGFPDAQDRPPGAGGRVELIELEGDHAIARRCGQLASVGRPKDDLLGVRT